MLYLPFVQEHVETSCEGAPVTCKYCRENVLRRDIERHERLACEEVPGSCEFQAVGCNHDKVAIKCVVDWFSGSYCSISVNSFGYVCWFG